MLEKLRLLQYRARIKLYRAEQRRTIDLGEHRATFLASGAGEPLVYLHSIIGESIWYPFHEGLNRSFAVTAPIHPGFGSAVGGGAEIDDLDDLIFYYLDLFAALGLERFHLVGASFGGRIAAEFALRYPERVKRLVLVDSFGLEVPGAPSAEPSALTRVEELRPRIFFNPRSFLGDLLLPATDDERKRAIARIGLTHPKLQARLKRIAAPTLLLWGAQDAIVPLAHANIFQTAIPQARLTTIEKCGHLPMFEQEEKFVAAVASFLRAGE
jgi:pimeloyl-ACP methyl ester carboxylesterase